MPARFDLPQGNARVRRSVMQQFLKDAGNCTVGPTYYKSCDCGAKSDETFQLAAPGHTYEQKSGKEPTCMEPGYTDYEECSVCGFVNGKEEIPTVDHNYIHVKASSGYVYDRSMQWNVYECKFGCGSSYTQFSAFVRNDKGMALSGATVRVSGENVDEEAVTDENGMATFAAHLTDGVYELRVFYDGADGVGTSDGKFTLSDGRGSGGFGSITTSGPVEEEPTTEPSNNDQPSDGNNGGNNNPAPNAPKRCSWCSINERWEGTPVIGWFVAFIHMIVHAANAR